MTPPPSQASGLVLALASAGCYGFNIAYARLASFDGVSGTTLVFYRVFVMLALIAGAALLARRSLKVEPGERGPLVALGLGTAVVGLAYLSAVAFVPVTVAVVIFYTFPILIVLLSPLVEGTRLDAPLLAIAAVAFAGVVLVVGPAFDGLDPRGLVLAGLASLAAATQFFAAARCRKTGVVAKTLWVHVLVLPATAAIGLAAGSLRPPGDLLLAPLAVTLTILGYVVGFALQVTALARTSAMTAGLAYCLEPLTAAVSSVLVLGETLSHIQVAGGTLVLAAIVANLVRQQRQAALPLRRPAPIGSPS